MLEVMRDYIDQLKFNAFGSPYLSKMRRALTGCLSYTINRMIDRDTRKEGMAHRISVTVKIVPCGINDQFQISRERIHEASLRQGISKDYIGGLGVRKSAKGTAIN